MAMKISILLVLFCCVLHVVSAQLRVGFYNTTCPRAETIVREVVQNRFRRDRSVTAALLRMHFHDCFVKGCDASILIDSTRGITSEKEAGPNQSVRGYDLIDEAKKRLEDVCPSKVSCADVIALATRDSVALAGGPSYTVPTGRRDGLVSNAAQVNMPGPDLSIPEALQFFTAKGLNLNEMVTLLGAHTVGVTHCSFIQNRISNNFQGTGQPDHSMEAALVSRLSRTCRGLGNSDPPVFLDQNTSFVFDNEFYNLLKKKRGVLKIDSNLESDGLSAPIVSSFAANGNLFRQSFVKAMIKMGNIEVLVGNAGEIRKDCRVVNRNNKKQRN